MRVYLILIFGWFTLNSAYRLSENVRVNQYSLVIFPYFEATDTIPAFSFESISLVRFLNTGTNRTELRLHAKNLNISSITIEDISIPLSGM